jgi:type III secretion system chaperone SycN
VTAAFWIIQAVEEFGRMLGFDELAFDERGVLQLDIENHGLLGLEHLPDGVVVYLIRPAEAERSVYRHALQLCHYSQSDQDWLQAALLGDGRLVFATRIPSSEFHLPELERAITLLSGLHDTVKEGVAA